MPTDLYLMEEARRNTENKITLLSTAYFGNIQYYTKLLFEECIIDPNEHYVKQSYRNRCEIMASNGVVPLSVNVHKGIAPKTLVKDVKIDYSKRWQHQHWQALRSAYRNSPYFDYYEDIFAYLFEKKHEFLIDLNHNILLSTFRILKPDAVPVVYSRSYINPAEPESMSDNGIEDKVIKDYRQNISPKANLRREDEFYRDAPYWQVFSHKHNFAPNLSILDLIFCEGPNAVDILKSSYRYK